MQLRPANGFVDAVELFRHADLRLKSGNLEDFVLPAGQQVLVLIKQRHQCSQQLLLHLVHFFWAGIQALGDFSSTPAQGIRRGP